MKKLLASPELFEYLSNQLKLGDVAISRCYIMLKNYRLIDHKKGMIRGEFMDTFNFALNLSELGDNQENLATVLKAMTSVADFAKHFEIGIEIRYPNPDKTKDADGLRNANRQLLEKPDCLLDLYADFVKNTTHLAKLSTALR